MFAFQRNYFKECAVNPVSAATTPINPPAPVKIDGELAYAIHALLCSWRLNGTFQYLIDWEGYGPEEQSFKYFTIVPIPKKPRPSGLNDYRPVALTSVVMKCFEKLVRDFITSSLPASMDPLQFAYHHNRSTDAIAHLLHTTLTHLDKGRVVRFCPASPPPVIRG
ncbi:hypothetical protein P4O66_001303 [Electrophorus voltai]|uniref:Reverse transcriptase domain-containing protein n=1 Tax=Electrophorus voltai TaxID=2609070 RepID=A0AAD9DUM6_9TELE|nr:hypothetical protein P4O66_001303 [Electrophorus voltai]